MRKPPLLLTGLSAAASLALAAICLSPATAAGTVVADYQMDEGVGAATMVDSSGSGNDGTITGAVDTTVTGRTGQPSDFAYGFGPGGIVKVPTRPSLNPGSMPISIDLWLRAVGPVGDWNVIQKGLSTTSGGQYKIEIHPRLNGTQGVPACTFHGVTAAGAAKASLVGASNVVDGSWHEVTCRYDGSRITLSVDGAVKKWKSASVGAISNTAVLAVGAKPSQTAGDDQYVGFVDDVTITFG